MTQILLKGFYNDNGVEVGVDEAGRGALAGPVTVAACIMPHGFQHPLIKDSKILSEGNRAKARQIVLDNAIAWSVVHIPVEKIEEVNILNATMIGMQQSLQETHKKVIFDFILIYGDQFHGFHGIPFVTVVGGDNKYSSIAAASILAKTFRDDWMKEHAEGNEAYGWGSNKGYGTKQHRDAIEQIGPSEHHRPSFISHMLTKTASLF